MAEQLAIAQSLLTGLGFPPSVGQAENATDKATDLVALPIMPPLPATTIPASDDKRTLLFAALDALITQAATPPLSLPLAAGPMGEVCIAADQCTLCAACVRICPSNALTLPGTILQLAFTEERCLQSGLCANVCPEQAITLVPRPLTSKAARLTPRVVAEAEPFSCHGCGKQFASKAMILDSSVDRSIPLGRPRER